MIAKLLFLFCLSKNSYQHFLALIPLSGVGTTYFHHVVIKTRRPILRPTACLPSTLLGDRAGAKNCKCSRDQRLASGVTCECYIKQLNFILHYLIYVTIILSTCFLLPFSSITRHLHAHFFILMSSVTQSIHLFLGRSLLGCPSTFILITLLVMTFIPLNSMPIRS
jgi:hypothetical protein